MITTKQRAFLRGKANGMPVILQVGKSGVTETIIIQANDAMTARELIKGKVLENAGLNTNEVADEIAVKTGADIVQVIGTKFILYKKNEKKPIYEME